MWVADEKNDFCKLALYKQIQMELGNWKLPMHVECKTCACFATWAGVQTGYEGT